MKRSVVVLVLGGVAASLMALVVGSGSAAGAGVGGPSREAIDKSATATGPLRSDLTLADPVSGTEHFTNVGIRLEPATDDRSAAAVLTGDEARAALEKGVPTPAVEDLSGLVTTTLAIYYNDVQGKMNDDESVTLSRQNMLTWVVTYPLKKPMPGHGTMNGATPRASVDGGDYSNCVDVGIVDAITGMWLQTFATCKAPEVPVK